MGPAGTCQGSPPTRAWAKSRQGPGHPSVPNSRPGQHQSQPGLWTSPWATVSPCFTDHSAQSLASPPVPSTVPNTKNRSAQDSGSPRPAELGSRADSPEGEHTRSFRARPGCSKRAGSGTENEGGRTVAPEDMLTEAWRSTAQDRGWGFMGSHTVFLPLPAQLLQEASRWPHQPWTGVRGLTFSISMWNMRGWGFCCRASRSAWPRELCSCIWAMPQQCRWPSRGSLPAAMLRRLLATSGYRTTCCRGQVGTMGSMGVGWCYQAQETQPPPHLNKDSRPGPPNLASALPVSLPFQIQKDSCLLLFLPGIWKLDSSHTVPLAPLPPPQPHPTPEQGPGSNFKAPGQHGWVDLASALSLGKTPDTMGVRLTDSPLPPAVCTGHTAGHFPSRLWSSLHLEIRGKQACPCPAWLRRAGDQILAVQGTRAGRPRGGLNPITDSRGGLPGGQGTDFEVWRGSLPW